jgi:Mlc titration factor MtfA (ptsG expression regulator)
MLAYISGFLWYPAALLTLLLVVFLVNKYRRVTHTQRVHLRNFPMEWLPYLEANVPMYKKMPMDLREDYQKKVWIFVEHKKFVPCGGLDEVTDEMKITIAGNACLLLINKDVQYPFPKVYSVLVYPTAFFSSANDEEELMLGEAWPGGSVVVAWDAARKSSRALRDGKNLILHEFTHQLDLEAGCDANGCPALDGFQHRVWAGVMNTEFKKFQDRIYKGKPTAMDHYGAEDPAEFFAVATETFFERPTRLKKHHPDLYEQLRLFYRVDPFLWHENGVGATQDEL